MTRKHQSVKMPSYDEFMRPIVRALIDLGGSGTIEEINSKVFESEKLNNEVLQIPHGKDGARTEVDYRLAWTRTFLKKYGLLNNSVRGIWSLTKSDITLESIDSDEIVRSVKEAYKKIKPKVTEDTSIKVGGLPEQIDFIDDWKQKLLNVLFSISPSAFERLTQRMLRESGFTQVEVTGKSGDGGIDGKGIMRISGILSFHIIFQCKRYKGAITPNQIRDFRGAMQGRADKGLFITTGSFTREAVKEATRDGAPPIDLIDGEIFCDKLKELTLGVTTKQIENIEIDSNWFTNL